MTDKVRILYCIDSVGYEAGPDRQLAEIIRRLDKARFDVHLCCFEDSPRMRQLGEHCTPLVLPLVRAYSPNGIRQICRLRRYINQHDIDIVHNFLVKANIVGVLAARKSKCRAIVSSRRDLGFWLTPLYLRMLRYLDRYTTRLLANSQRVKDFVVKTERVPRDRVDVLYNGVDMTSYAPGCGDPSVVRSLGVPDHAKLVGIVANFRPVKDHALFLRAARSVADRVSDAAFVLVGTGALRGDLGRLAEELGIAGRVFFADGRGTARDYLGRMAVGCLSSETEGFSNALLEYMAAGLPVAATDAGGNAEAVENGVTGFIVPHGNPAALAQPIIELLKDDNKRIQMGRQSRARCRRMFEIGDAVRRFEDYYTGLAAQAAGRPS